MRFRGLNAVMLGVVPVLLAILGLLAWGIVYVATRSRPADPRVFMFVVLGLFAAGFSAFFLNALALARGIAVDSGTIRVATGWGRWTRPVTEVAGVGLLYIREQGRGTPGWYLMIADANGDVCLARQFVVVSWRLPTKPRADQRQSLRDFGRPWPADLPLPSEDSTRLAASRPGRVARRIYDFVTRAQGDEGALAKRALQKHQRFTGWDQPQQVAFWSPDGEMGRLV
jgi:hypothetical protein